MDKPRHRLAWLGEIALFLVLVLGIQAWQSRKVARGVPAILSGTSVTGAPLSTEALRGKPAVVHFWATWCGVCRAEEGTIEALSHRVPMVTVASSSGTAAEVAAALADRHLTLPTLNDPEGMLASRFGVHSFPTTLILDSTGKVSWVTVGYTTSLGLRARLLLTR